MVMSENQKIIFHIDVNSAYLSWTAVKMLQEGAGRDIREIPCIVGGDKKSRHGIVLAKSILAKKYGVKTGEPVVNALRKCPDLEMVPPEHGYYEIMSKKLMELLRSYTPDIEQVSIDECYMDYTGIQNRYSSPQEAAETIKNKVKEQLGFTVNIGISDVKVLAKMASDFEKPDKVHTLYKNEIQRKMWGLPVGELFMAGKSSVDTLHKLGIFTIGQLAKSPVSILESHLKSHGRILWEYANGIDDSVVNTEKEELKGVGNSTTLSKDLDDLEEIFKVLLTLSEKVGRRLREGKQRAKTVAVEIKYNNFVKCSRQTTIESATDSGTEIYGLVKILFQELWNQTPVRLLGVRTANLTEQGEPQQLTLSDMENWSEDKKENRNAVEPSREKMHRLDEALDAIKKKYGKDAVKRASLMEQNREKKRQNSERKQT
jgi:nucleotidyltransferase/DNA polymerase involved in DNA repair